MPDYDALRATAERLIGSFGSEQTVTITRVTVASYDPVTDTTTATTATYTVKGVIVGLGTNELETPNANLTLYDSTSVIIPALGLGIVPMPGDRIALPGESEPYIITDVGPTRPDGNPIFYKLMVKRAGA